MTQHAIEADISVSAASTEWVFRADRMAITDGKAEISFEGVTLALWRQHSSLRARCHALLDDLPEIELPGVVEDLTDRQEFYASFAPDFDFQRLMDPPSPSFLIGSSS